MKKKTIVLAFALLISIFSLSGCNQAAAQPTPDSQATVSAAVAATQAVPNTQATIDASVQATLQAQQDMQTAIDQAVQATLAAQPTPEYSNLSEEELAALIDEAVTQAIAASEQAATATTSTASDGTVTTEEVTYTYTYVYDTAYAVAYAEELIAAYYEYYGEYAETALTELQQIEDDLNAISDSMEEITVILEQGAEAATAAVEQLNAAAAQAQAQVAQAQEKAQGWQQEVQASLQAREESILNMAPTDIATDRAGAINQAHDFLESFKTAMGDGKFSPQELQNIGQLSANLRASFEGMGISGGEFGNISGMAENLTRQAARGDWGRAKTSMGEFERNLPERGGRPSRP